VKDREPVALRDALLTRGINTSVSLLEDARLDMEARDLASLLRASVHYYNTDDEIERFAREIEALAR
jgi:cysteine desulfurase / selenocysteine lyase